MSLSVHFALPAAAPVVLLAPAAAVALLLFARARTRRLERALGPRAPVLAAELGVGRRRARIVLFASALLLGGLAVMQPRWGKGTTVLTPRGADLLVCLDVSRSMLAEDVKPSRLDRAREEIRALTRRAAGDRLGLVVFAGDARLRVPLTRDLDSFGALATRAGPLSVSRGGSDPGAALLTALEALAGRSEGPEAILLISDGEDLAARASEAARTCRARGVPVHCLGLGSTRGAKIPNPPEDGGGFVRDRAGRDVVTMLHSGALREIAGSTGGVYAEAGSEPGALVDLYEGAVLPLSRRSFRADERRERENRFQWPLLAAILLWCIDLSFSERRR